MSNRLQSLNTKKPGAAKPSLKFKPKAVERKSKEERDKNVKIKQEESEKHQHKPSTRGGKSGRGRGGRRDQYANTHVLSSGLFASGAVSAAGLSKENKVFNSVSPSPEFILGLKLREGTPKSGSSESEDEGDDLTKIDMSKEYKFADAETALFPVRPIRQEDEEEIVQVFSKDPSPVKIEPFDKEGTAKSENIETELQQILTTKANLESKISQPVDLLNQAESEKLSNDHNQILRMFDERFASENSKYSLLQLPKILPDYNTEVSSKKESKQLEKNKSKESDKETKEETNPFASNFTSVDGEIGKLNIHKSGRITINLGNDINLDLTAGVSSNFLQELVLLDLSEPATATKPTKDEETTEETEKVKVKQEDDMAIDVEDDGQVHDVDDDNDNDEQVSNKGTMNKMGEVDGKLIATPIIF